MAELDFIYPRGQRDASCLFILLLSAEAPGLRDAASVLLRITVNSRSVQQTALKK